MAAKRKLRLAVEQGPKAKKVAVFALDWPGLERGAKTEEAAIEAVLDYVPRYAAIAAHADLEPEYSAVGAAHIVDRYLSLLGKYARKPK